LVGGKIIVSQTLPNRLLNATGNAKRREISRFSRIGKVSGHAQLEAPMTIRLEIVLTELRVIELLAERLNLRPGLTSRKLSLELISIATSDWCRIDENKPRWFGIHATCRRLARVQQSEKSAPRVANERKWSNLELLDDAVEIANLSLPGDVALALA
jgi:hypothetical protein